MDLARVDAGALALSVLLVAFSCTGMGFVFGSLSLVVRDGWMVTSTFISALYILSGVNFPVASLPAALQPVAYALPLTRGVMAARLALHGAAARRDRAAAGGRGAGRRGVPGDRLRRVPSDRAPQHELRDAGRGVRRASPIPAV